MSEHKPGPGLYVRREARAAPFYPARRKMAGACSLSGMPRLQSLFRAAPITLINMHPRWNARSRLQGRDGDQAHNGRPVKVPRQYLGIEGVSGLPPQPISHPPVGESQFAGLVRHVLVR
jgi:hypothetical protein